VLSSASATYNGEDALYNGQAATVKCGRRPATTVSAIVMVALAVVLGAVGNCLGECSECGGARAVPWLTGAAADPWFRVLVGLQGGNDQAYGQDHYTVFREERAMVA
jgi:hypothetical protein